MKLQAILIVLLSTALCLNSCKDPCKNVTCENGGICMNVVCVCPGVYTSSDCELISPERLDLPEEEEQLFMHYCDSQFTSIIFSLGFGKADFDEILKVVHS